MSGLVGIWNLDGDPVSREILSAMSARLAHRGPDGESLLVRGPAGFAYQNLQITLESLHEVQPFEHTTGAILLWDGRLDNRSELICDLAGHPEVTQSAPDATLVAAAYAAFGEDFLARLDGDFALALFDAKQSRLLLARDVMSARTLYYYRSGSHFLFASEIKALMAHPAVRTGPDDRTVAEWLYQIPDYTDETRTFFKDIHSVFGGTVISMTPEGMKSRRYWDFDTNKQLRLRSYPEYVEAYKETYLRAVRNRLRSVFPVAISLSGGLDSSSIYCAAHELKITDSEAVKEIVGIGVVPSDAAGNEEEYQAAAVNKYSGQMLKIPLSVGGTVGPVCGHGAWHSEGPLLKWQVWRTALMEAERRNARVFLSGYFGDQVLTNPHYLVDLALSGKFTTAYHHTRAYLRWWPGLSLQASVSQFFKMARGYLLPERLRPLYHRLGRPLSKNLVPYIPWYSGELAHAAHELDRSRRPIELPKSRAHVKILYHYLNSRLLNLRWEMELKTDSEFPSAPAFPYRDRQLVALLMSMPGEIVYQSGSRGIHRDAMKGILPEMIRLRRNKASFLDPAKQGAKSDLDLLRPVLNEGGVTQPSFIGSGALFRDSVDHLRSNLEECTDATLPWLANDLVGLQEWLTAFFPRKRVNG